MTAKVSIIGSGSWATALTKILTHNRHDVTWWVRTQDTASHILNYHHNPRYLSSVEFFLPEGKVTADLEYAFTASDYILLATPSAYILDTLKGVSKNHWHDKKTITAIKGIVPDRNIPVSEFLHHDFDIPFNHIANISGPCHAEEVAAEKLSYLTFSSPDEAFAKEVAGLFETRFLNTEWSNDLGGTEYASVIKNIYAIAAGISAGLDYGDNFRAVLVSQSMTEMAYFLDHIHPSETRNILASAYLGDTLVTCYSPYSRNRTFGVMIGKGYSIKSAILELNMVAEGYYASKAIKAIADKHGLSMPVMEAVYNILYRKVSPEMEFRLLTQKLN